MGAVCELGVVCAVFFASFALRPGSVSLFVICCWQGTVSSIVLFCLCLQSLCRGDVLCL